MAITSKADLLYGWDASLGVWTGPGEQTFTRDGKRYYFARDGLYRPVYDDVKRHPYPDVEDHRKRALELALGDTPVTDDSARFEPANTAWTAVNLGSQAAKTSIFKTLPTNGEARQLVGDGTATARLTQSAGSSTGSKETLVTVWEDDGSGGRTRDRIRDSTGVYAQVDYDFAGSGIVVDAGQGFATVLTDSGPNGGETVLVFTIGTGNNTSGRLADVFFDDAGDGSGAILHYAALHELAHSPGLDPQVGTASAIPAEKFSVSPGPYRSDVAQVGYIGFVAGTLVGDTGGFLRVMEYGDGSDPRVRLLEDANVPGNYFFDFRDTNGNKTSLTFDVGASTPLQRIEVVYAYDPSDGQVRAIGRADGGSWVDSGASTPSSWTTPTSLGSNNQVVYNEDGGLDGTGRGRQFFHEHLIALAPSLDNDPFTGGASAVGDELAAVQPTTITE